jgi:hypothetical protein
MKNEVIRTFIQNYSKSDFNRIIFAWNGKHRDQLEDPNMDLRIQVCEFLVHDFSAASDELILDLYQELSKSSKETWSVYRNYHLFAQETLNRGKTKYLMKFLEGASQSFDTTLASGRIDISLADKEEIIQFVERKLANDPGERDRRLLEFALKRFGT